MRPQIVTPWAAIAEFAARGFGVVSREQLRTAGLSDPAIARAIRRRLLHRVHRGVYAVGHTAIGEEGRMLAAVLACGSGAVLSHLWAAALWRLCAPCEGPVDVISTASRGGTEASIRLHRVRLLDPADTTVHQGIPVTTPARALVDISGAASRYMLERAVAQAEVLGLCGADEIAFVLERSRGKRGTGVLRGLIAGAPALTRSELERRFLALCDRHGLPRPQANVRVLAYEVDFLWPDARLVVEVDGHTFHRTRRAFEVDRRRDADLLVAGYRVLRFTYRRLAEEPEAIVRTVRGLIRA